jgi:hypothetical protein
MEPVGAVNECGGELSKHRKWKLFSDCLHIGLHIVSSHTACSNLITDSMTQDALMSCCLMGQSVPELDPHNPPDPCTLIEQNWGVTHGPTKAMSGCVSMTCQVSKRHLKQNFQLGDSKSYAETAIYLSLTCISNNHLMRRIDTYHKELSCSPLQQTD